MLQVICTCGRIAEVRHRSNGKKLAYSHCLSCGGGVVSTVKAAKIESKAQNDIGVKGEFLNQVTDNVQSKQVHKLEDFKPEAKNNLNQNLDQKNNQVQNNQVQNNQAQNNGYLLYR